MPKKGKTLDFSAIILYNIYRNYFINIQIKKGTNMKLFTHKKTYSVVFLIFISMFLTVSCGKAAEPEISARR